jgi:hypothetical protein
MDNCPKCGSPETGVMYHDIWFACGSALTPYGNVEQSESCLRLQNANLERELNIAREALQIREEWSCADWGKWIDTNVEPISLRDVWDIPGAVLAYAIAESEVKG